MLTGKINRTDETPAIVVRNVSKEFVIPHEKRTTLFENIKGIFSPPSYEKFTALKNVDFVVERGESVGIIGDNGSGKSTLLKIIAKILRPTTGSVEVNGKITPFLELGVGFQPDLTAKENIEVYSTIMGISRKDIAKNIDNVLDFAGMSKFRDTKLKNFSSGMQVRLAFATAIQSTPDILLVDEVLAVGDIDFQQKCLDIFTNYKKQGITMVFVSHDLSAVRRFCDKTLLLKNGKVVAFGKTSEIIDKYVYGAKTEEIAPENITHKESDAPGNSIASGLQQETDKKQMEVDGRWGNHKIVISDVQLFDKYGHQNNKISTGDSLTIKIHYTAHEPIQEPVFGIIISSDNDILCYGTNTDIEGLDLGTVSGNGSIDIVIPFMPLLNGKFYITVAAHSKNNVTYDWLDKKYYFTVINTGRKIGMTNIKSEWIIV
ncbi:ABC transporter ATP-binding protein [Methanocella arvoryzae]|uniref:ABC-type transport system, ATPase component n=1 Tax=Methanocella arvoryzae (strain DSM 22066 / NBRC 105507 / MRE50) TaxID=351160 RepID=Q0W7E8_METAR|nr:ABC transporter ATP-binding protein [Methanocella arvoryzae]CAJ35695.1 putative ABC-type transport system, ATPase component [Methanocella arvoryzae MRE50]